MVKIPQTNQERCRKFSEAVKSDTQTLQKNRIETGYHPKQVEDVIEKSYKEIENKDELND